MKKKLFSLETSFGLNFFRTLFGILIVFQTLELFTDDFFIYTFDVPDVLLPYQFSGFLPRIPYKYINFLSILQIVGGVLILFKKHVRIGAFTYLLSFGYFFLMDMSYYNNHYYLILILTLFFCFYPKVSVKNNFVFPKYYIWLFKFQIIIVYFFGGLAKLNKDWLFNHEPMKMMLENAFNQNLPISFILLFSVGGILFDLFIGFLLIWKRTVYLAVIASCVFHISNHFIFSSGENAVIGIFPFFMLGINLIFLPYDFYRNKLKLKTKQISDSIDYSKAFKKMVLLIVSLHIFIQLILPIRHYFIPGYVDWTSEGFYFAWRMKIRHKEGKIKIDIKDGVTGERTFVALKSFLNPIQVKFVAENPMSMYRFLKKLKVIASDRGINEPEFYAVWWATLNNGEKYLVVDSTLNLLDVNYKWYGNNDWILKPDRYK